MEKEGLWPAILHFARNVGITIVCIFALAGLSCLSAAWRTFFHLGNRVMLLGVLVMAVGVGCAAGRPSVAGHPREQLIPGNNTYQRIRQWVADSMSGHRFTTTTRRRGGLGADTPCVKETILGLDFSGHFLYNAL